MVFGFLKRKKKQASPVDPLAAFDGLIEQLEQQGAQLRRSAATLLTLRGQLTRDLARYEEKQRDADRRLKEAITTGDDASARVLTRDRDEAGRLAQVTSEGLAQVSTDAELLVEAGEETAKQLSDLKLERQSAAARLHAGTVVSLALRQQVEKLQQAIALDAARDEVERAHQLAQIYREERSRSGP